MLALLEREGVGAPTPVAAPPDVRSNADAVRLRLEQLEDKYADGDLTRAGYVRNRDRLTARLAELERAEALTRMPGPLEGVTAGPLGGAAAGTPPGRRGLPGGRDPAYPLTARISTRS